MHLGCNKCTPPLRLVIVAPSSLSLTYLTLTLALTLALTLFANRNNLHPKPKREPKREPSGRFVVSAKKDVNINDALETLIEKVRVRVRVRVT